MKSRPSKKVFSFFTVKINFLGGKSFILKTLVWKRCCRGSVQVMQHLKGLLYMSSGHSHRKPGKKSAAAVMFPSRLPDSTTILQEQHPQDLDSAQNTSSPK